MTFNQAECPASSKSVLLGVDPASNFKWVSLSLRERQWKQLKKMRKGYVLKRLSLISLSVDEAPTSVKKPTAPIFTEVPSVIISSFRFQLYNLDIHTKPSINSWASPDFTTAAEIFLSLHHPLPLDQAFQCQSNCWPQTLIIWPAYRLSLGTSLFWIS